MEDFDVELFPPTYIGPTWRRSASGKFITPDKTLGWTVAGWCTKYLLDPNGDGPWRFTFEQLRFVLWWFALDETGRFTYRRGLLQRLKGWGKDPLAAVISLVELCGPSRFSHWDDEGNPVAKAHPAPWVEVYGVSKESTRNTSSMFPQLMSDALRADYGISDGKEVIYANNGRGALLMKSGGYRSAEGGRVTFMVLGEVQHWTPNNGGQNLFKTITKNAVKTRSRWLAITNAYLPGEESVGEKIRADYDAVAEGRAKDTGLLYDSIEAHEKTPLTEEALRAVVPLIRGDATWLDVEDIIADIQSGTSEPSQSRRMWLNQIVSTDEALVTEAEFDELLLDDKIRPGESIVMGFDGGHVDDATALVAIRVEDGLIYPLLLEEKNLDDDNWEVDRDLVDEVVRSAFETYDVQAFFCDVRLWESHISEWSKDYGSKVLVQSQGRNAFSWDMRGGALRRVTLANEFIVRAIRQGHVAFGGMTKLLPAYRRHVINARRVENTYGVSFGKETKDSPKKVDGWAATVIAAAAWDAVRQSGKKRKRAGRTWNI